MEGKAQNVNVSHFRASELIPLSTSSAWDEIYASLNASPYFHLTGPDSLASLCDEAHFVRSNLKKTWSTLIEGSTQADAALFCLKLMRDDVLGELQIAFAKLLPHSLLHADKLPELTQAKAKAAHYCLEKIKFEFIPRDMQIAFAKLLPHLLHAETSPELRTAIQQLETQRFTTLPEASQKAISVYLEPESKRESEFLTRKSRTAAQTVLSKLRGWISALFRRK